MIPDPETNKRILREWLPQEGCFSDDIICYYERLLVVSEILQLHIEELGKVQDKPIFLISPKQLSSGPHILIAGCFHGDEPAGSWSILRFLKNLKSYPTDFNLSFLPLVNPTGFERKIRTNYLNQDSNRGYCHTQSGSPEPSEEGIILLRQLPKVNILAQDIFLSLHEDWELTKFYIYSFEESHEPGLFTEALKFAERQYFEPYPDGLLEGGTVKDGVIFKFCDGSFEDMLFHNGTKMTACTETPGKMNLETRINANSYIIDRLCKFTLSLNKNINSKR
jgi:hypothetical protein